MKLLLGILIFSGIGFAQSVQHTVTLNWTDTANPAGTTYNVYRNTNPCVSATFGTTPIATGIAVKTYVDSTVVNANYCYQVTAVANGLESGPSPTVQAAVGAFPPSTLSATVK